MVQPVSQYETGYEGNSNPNYPAIIANGQQESATINQGGFSLCGVLIPAAFTGTSISFEASIDNVTFYPVYNTIAGVLLSYVVAPSRYIAIDPKDFHGIQYLKIKSGSAEGAARTLVASLKGF